MEHPFFKATQQPVAYLLHSLFGLSSKDSLALARAFFLQSSPVLSSLSLNDSLLGRDQVEKIVSTLLTLKKTGALETLCTLSSYEPYPSTLHAIYTYLRYERRMEPGFLNQVKKNPYILQEAQGVGFLTIDRLARKMGIEAQSPVRLMAMGKHALDLASAQTGGACLKEQFLYQLRQLLLTDGLIDYSEIPQVIQHAYAQFEKKTLFISESAIGKTFLFSKKLFHAEEYCAQKIFQMNLASSHLSVPDNEQLEHMQTLRSIHLTEEQQAAVLLPFQHKLSIISGRPGSGKTTLLKVLHPLLVHQNKKVHFVAPTGKAAKKISQALGTPAHTIHRLLAIGVDDDINSGSTMLDSDLLVVDESSMLDIYLMKRLLASVPAHCHILLIGDPDQLPSIGPGKVLKDLLDSLEIPHISLSKIQRQMDGSNIIDTALSVLSGALPVLEQKTQDCVFLCENEAPKIGTRIVNILQRNVQGKYSLIHDVQILSPTKQGPSGTDELNVFFQEQLNPHSSSKNELVLQNAKKRKFLLREGDKVIHLSNDIERERYQRNSGRKEQGVFNGEQGVVRAINPYTQMVTVDFDDFYSEYTLKDAQQALDLAYCITIHKFQGSEAPVIFFIGHSSAAPMLRSKNLLYTGITRAKSKCILIGSPDFFHDCCQRDGLSSRQTRLEKLLTGECALQLECPPEIKALSEEKHLKFVLKDTPLPLEEPKKSKRL